jgi:hypothetical protein
MAFWRWATNAAESVFGQAVVIREVGGFLFVLFPECVFFEALKVLSLVVDDFLLFCWTLGWDWIFRSANLEI